MALEKYRVKRNFSKTKEPTGNKKAKENALIFVIQKHQASHLHYDFRLEEKGVLKSWAVPKGLPKPGEKRLAMMVEDHPIEYQHFEGIIPKGNYGAGAVMIWDNGTYSLINKKSIHEGLEKGEFSFILEGKKINGEFSLVKLKKGAENSWLMICKEAKKINTNIENLSVISNKSMEQIAAGDFGNLAIENAKEAIMPDFIKPMLATTKEKAFNDANWLFEIKWDGYRVIARKEKDKCHLFSRNRKSFDEVFFPICESLKDMQGDFILDGEVVAIDENGKSSFQLLQNYFTTRKGILIYYVFDILFLDGKDLTNINLEERKNILNKFLPKLSNIKISEHIEEQGKKLFEQISKLQNEGIVAKKKTSKYYPGTRSNYWLKIKSVQTQEAVIIGFTQPRGGRKKFGALILAKPDVNGELQYIGHTGGGFDDASLEFVQKKMIPLIIEKCPLKVKPKTNAQVTWIRPELIAEIKFAESTQDGIMRQPIFLGLREDKSISDVQEQQIGSIRKQRLYKVNSEEGVEKIIDEQKLKLTHLEKVFWPKEGYTKEDLINYYISIAKYILPYLKDRPQSLNRFPNGIEDKNFFHKDVTDAPKWIQTKKVYSESEDKEINYLICQKTADLVYMVNLGCIEINPWNSRIQQMEKPDYIVFDIDPLDAPFSWAIKVAQELKKILDEIKIKGYCKTSGSRGLHVFVPVAAQYDYEFVKEFARLVNMIINTHLPDITSLERSPLKRAQKVYLDFLQNRKGQTMASAYSVRPKPGATVSMPLEWDEVNEDLDPSKFNIMTAEKRLKEKGDLFKGVLGKGADINKALERLSQSLKK